MSNACYSKTTESLQPSKKIRVDTTAAQVEKFVKRMFKNFNFISDELVSISLSTSSALWNKSTPVVAATMDLSKLSSYKFHNEETLLHYGSDRLNAVFKNTVSFLYRNLTNNLYANISTFKHLPGLSDKPEVRMHYDRTNKKFPLTMTDERNGKL